MGKIRCAILDQRTREEQLARNVQQYHAGETVEAASDFMHGDRVESVTATFAYTDDPDAKLHLSGTPDEEAATEGAGGVHLLPRGALGRRHGR